MTASSDHGPLGPIVQTVGWMISSALAISFAWRRRARFEPSEVDIPKAPERVGGLFTAVLLGILFSQLSDPASVPLLVRLAVWAGSITLIALLLYGFLVAALTYEKEDVDPAGNLIKMKIIGGFWKTANAKQQLRSRKALTVQRLLKGCRNDPDAVWPKAARGLSKQAFVLSYLMLTVCGTFALSCAAILVILKNKHS